VRKLQTKGSNHTLVIEKAKRQGLALRSVLRHQLIRTVSAGKWPGRIAQLAAEYLFTSKESRNPRRF
jgi:hypothetical protein